LDAGSLNRTPKNSRSVASDLMLCTCLLICRQELNKYFNIPLFAYNGEEKYFGITAFSVNSRGFPQIFVTSKKTLQFTPLCVASLAKPPPDYSDSRQFMQLQAVSLKSAHINSRQYSCISAGSLGPQSREIQVHQMRQFNSNMLKN
jgi:hypothetical protein